MKREEATETLLVLHEKWVKAAKEHLREIVAGVVAVVLVLAAFSGYRAYKEGREKKASLLYIRAVTTQNATKKMALLEELVRRYPGTSFATEARLSLFELRLSKGERDLFPLLKRLRKETRGEVRLTVFLGEGYLYEETGNLKKATEVYQKVISKAKYLSKVVYGDLARVYELSGKKKEAYEAYLKYKEVNQLPEGVFFLDYKLKTLSPKE